MNGEFQDARQDPEVEERRKAELLKLIRRQEKEQSAKKKREREREIELFPERENEKEKAEREKAERVNRVMQSRSQTCLSFGFKERSDPHSQCMFDLFKIEQCRLIKTSYTVIS